MSEERESLGRIEVAPDVLALIAHHTVLGIDGVARMAPIPAQVGRFFRRGSRQSGVLLNLSEDNRVKFDIYVIMAPSINIMQASRTIQTAVTEAIDKMVGIPVEAVNVHVEDVTYAQDNLD